MVKVQLTQLPKGEYVVPAKHAAAVKRYVEALNRQVNPPMAIPTAPGPEPAPFDRITRFREFVTDYVLKRAAFFEPGREDEQAWEALSRAKSIYKAIERSTHSYADALFEEYREQEQKRQKELYENMQAVQLLGHSIYSPKGFTGPVGPAGVTGAVTSPPFPPLTTKRTQVK